VRWWFLLRDHQGLFWSARSCRRAVVHPSALKDVAGIAASPEETHPSSTRTRSRARACVLPRPEGAGTSAQTPTVVGTLS